MSNDVRSSGNSSPLQSIADLPKLLELCVDRLNDAIVITEAEPINNPGPRIVWANKVFYLRNGYAPEEIIGQSPRILQGPLTDRATLDRVRAALEKWQPIRAEILNYRKDGTSYWNEFEIVPIANEQGWFTHWVSVQRDITERKLIEQALKQSKSQVTAILNSTTESVFHVDKDGIILAINDSAARRVHKVPQEMLGKSAFDFFPPELALSRRKNMEEVFHTGKVNYSEDARNDHFFSLNYYPNFDTEGKVASVVVYATDITARKKASNSLRESEEKLRGLFQLSHLGIALNDMKGRYIEFNEAFQRICGYSKEELNQLDYWALTPEKYKADEEAQLLSLQQTSRYGPYEKEYIRKDGSLIPILLNGTLITGKDGEKFIWSIVEDISERQLMLAELRESEERFRQMFERNSAVMLLIEPQTGMIVDANPAAAAFYGYPLTQLRGKSISSINIQTEAQISTEIQQALTQQCNYFVFDHRLANGDIRTVEVHSSPVSFKNISLLFSIINDITDRKLAEEQIRHLAFYDTLTKVPNRRLLVDRLDHTIAAGKRNACFAALMFLDLDNFKPLNDNHGHKVGDLLLIEAARRISSCIRETDTVARFGGDEFVIMLSELKQDESESTVQAGHIAEKIRNSIAEPYRLVVQQDETGEITVEHHCTSSIGVVIFNYPANREEVLKWADMAMYEAKHAGRNCVVINRQQAG
jgi:diguanylate cyclase (GGDEF)-like protein/PAS domain S-box-containing protein